MPRNNADAESGDKGERREGGGEEGRQGGQRTFSFSTAATCVFLTRHPLLVLEDSCVHTVWKASM